ncbi:glycosyltransferase [Candidatus Saccharibacteria bacterium]|nr:glycosyltransferase [Candidatus Saccharibacteria bacterium]
MELEDRIDLINIAKKEKRKIAMYLVEDEESAQFRYRVCNVMEVLDDHDSSWQAVYFLNSEIDEVKKHLGDIDLLIILRQSAKDNKLLKIIDLVKQEGKKVLFDLDDLIFDFRDLALVMRSTKSVNIFYWALYISGVRRIAKRVDGFLVTNDFLGKKIKRSFSKPYKVISNSLNKRQVRVFNDKKKAHDGFVIGYFSGSPTHTKDFRVAESGIIKFLNNHEDAKILVVGFLGLSESMGSKLKEGKIELLKPVKYLKMQTLFEEVDVNIAPLVINDFTNCKSDLKFFEAAAAETTTIASPSYAFKKAISDGENGFLAKPNEWYDKLEYLYNNPKENQKIAKKAREYALKHYYGEEFLKEVEKAYEAFI